MSHTYKRGSIKVYLPIILAAVLVFSLIYFPREPATDDHPETSEYVTRIAELESEVAMLKETLTELSKEETVPTQPPSPEESTTPAETATFHYRIFEGNAYITGFEGNAAMVTVPSELEKVPVVGIDDRAFEGRSVAAIVLPTSIESIGWFAFLNCTSLSEISIPDTTAGIGYGAFDGCPNLSIRCSADSYAAKYAKSYGIPYKEP